MKEAYFVPILTHPRLEACDEAVASQNKQLTIVFSIKGQNATSFCKDLTREFITWQITNPEQLHQKILDLLSFTRQKKIEIEFALSLLMGEQIVFATYAGTIILKRANQVRKILQSEQEIKIIVGNFKDNDQIILLNGSAAAIETYVLSLLNSSITLEKLVSEISLLKQEQHHLTTSLVFLTYKQKIINNLPTKKVEIDFHQILTRSKMILNKLFLWFKTIYFKLKNQNRKKLLIWLSTFVVLNLFFFGGITLLRQQRQKITQNITSKIEQIKQNNNNIEQLMLSQPLQAREITQQKLVLLEALKQEKNNSQSLKLIDLEIDQVKKLIEKISGENSLDKLSIAYNLNNFLGSKVVIKDGEVFVLENSGQEILHLKKDQTTEKINLNNEKIRDFTVTEGKLFAISNGIWLLDLKTSNNQFTQIKEEGESDRQAELLSSFGPYLYLLNKEKRNIYRYYYNQDKLSEPIGWLIDKTGISFENISDLMVDGDLWLGFKNGLLLKFSKGKTVDLAVQGLKQTIENPILLSSSEKAKVIAVLEKQNKRLLILTKDGQLLSEIKSNELAGTSDIALAEDGSKVYILSGSVIYDVKIDPK